MNLITCIKPILLGWIGLVLLASCDVTEEPDRRLRGTWDIDFDSLGHGSIELYQEGRDLTGRAVIAGEIVLFDKGHLESADTSSIWLYNESEIWPVGQPIYISLRGRLNAEWTVVVGRIFAIRDFTKEKILDDSFIMTKR